MDLQQAFNVLEHKFEDGVGIVVGTGIRREEWLPIRAALVEALKPAHNSAMDEICPHCQNGRTFQPVSDGWRASRCGFCKGSGKLSPIA